MKKLSGWKNPAILLASIGIANIGNFIHLVAINIVVYQLTGSATAVAGLWIIGPLISILTKFWTGSFVDYRSKRQIMMTTYIIRAIFIATIPFASNIVTVYIILVVLNIANSFFTPASMTYATMLVPENKRKRFNSIRSFASSGSFIMGPATGGAFILLTSIEITLWINSIFFIISAILLLFLPEKESIDKETIPALTLSQVVSDFTIVWGFMVKNKYVSFIYLGFISVMIFSFAMDAQEVVFIQEVIGLTEYHYSLLISIAGIGSVVGAITISIYSNKIPLRYMISLGLPMVTVGYTIYAFSWSFASVSVGFIILGFFNSFLNAGMMTFYQNNVPIDIMGRVTSIFQLVQSIGHVIFLLSIGILADLISLRLTIVTLALIMLTSSIIFSYFVLKEDKKGFYQDVKLDS